MKQLRDYQTKGINQLATKYSQGKKRLLFQLATGGGKTVCFAGLINRYLQRHDKNVLILVHREELLKQARKTIFEWYGIIAEPVTAGVRSLPTARVYVAMAETANNRLKRFPAYFPNIGLVIVDECHLGSFRKLLLHFPASLTIGFTATPISASRKEPLNGIYEDIVTGIDIPELIAEGSLCGNRTYHIKNINRKSLSLSKGEFDEKAMGIAYSKPKQVGNTLEGYTKFCAGKKTLIFNCNVAHSLLVTEAFVAQGLPCKHLDGTSKNRSELVDWFKNTPGAILCNVGVLTTGFDEPSTEAIIMNKATMSLPLWLQCTGRGSRPFPGKETFTIVDMGGNAITHGDWSASRDWADLFNNPDKPSDGGGVSPVKECVQCEALIGASVKVCPYCGADNSAEMQVDTSSVEFELLSTSDVNVSEAIAASEGRKDYYSLHRIKEHIVNEAQRKGVRQLTDTTAYALMSAYQSKVKEWCKEKGKAYNQWHKDTTGQWIIEELKKVYGWQPTELTLTA